MRKLLSNSTLDTHSILVSHPRSQGTHVSKASRLTSQTLEVEIKQGATVEDALRSVYHWSQKFSRDLLLQCWTNKLSRDKADSKKNHVIEGILKKVKSDTAKEDFDLEGPQASPLHDKILMEYIDKAFDRVVSEVQDSENKNSKRKLNR